MGKKQRRTLTPEETATALRLRRASCTYEQIAEELGYAKSTVWRSVQKAMKETIREPAEELRLWHHDKLEELIRYLWPGVQAGIPRSAEVALKALESMASLHGLNAPKKVQDVTPLVDEAKALAKQLGVDETIAVAKAEEIIRAAQSGK